MTFKEGHAGFKGSPRARSNEDQSEDTLDRAIDETIRRYFMEHDPPARAYARVLEAARPPAVPRHKPSTVRTWIIGVASATAALLLVNLTLQSLGKTAALIAADAPGRGGLFLLWLSSTNFARWVNESETIFGYSGILFLHTLGLAVVVGTSVVVDLRLLGAASRISVAAIRPLFRYMWWGFGVNALSGAMLFAADAPRKAANPLFEFKLALIALGVAVMALMEHRLLQAESKNAQLAASTPRLNTLAIGSLLIWGAAIVAGRLVAYTF